MKKETHAKPYVAPALATKGDAVTVTRMAGLNGTGDPDNIAIWRKPAVGAVGFLL